MRKQIKHVIARSEATKRSLRLLRRHFDVPRNDGRSIRLVILLWVAISFAGCSAFTKHILHHEPELAVHDRVLVYDRPYDYTFLKTIEALNTFPEWVLEETDKNKGLIVIRNTQYGHLFDKDKWVARFNIRRLDKRKTSVALEPSSQRLEKGGELLDRIDEVVNISSNIEGIRSAPQAAS